MPSSRSKAILWLRRVNPRVSQGMLLVAFLVAFGNRPPLLAQNSVSGSLRGYVKDEVTRTPIARARIEARHATTGALWSTVTFADGSYTLPLLSPGEYRVRCQHPQYEPDSYGPVYINLVRTTTLKLPPFYLRRQGSIRNTYLWPRPGEMRPARLAAAEPAPAMLARGG